MRTLLCLCSFLRRRAARLWLFKTRTRPALEKRRGFFYDLKKEGEDHDSEERSRPEDRRGR